SSRVTLAVCHRGQHAGAALHPPTAGEIDRPALATRDGEYGVDLVERGWRRAQPASDRAPGERVGERGEVAPPRFALAGPGGTRERGEDVGLGPPHAGLAGEHGGPDCARAPAMQRAPDR